MPKGKAFDAIDQSLRNRIPEGFFSTMDELITAAPGEKMSAQQWRDYLSPGRILEREGVAFPLKKEELEYSGVLDLLKDLDPNMPLQKNQLRDFHWENRPEVVRGKSGVGGAEDAVYGRYSTHGPYRTGYFESQTRLPTLGKTPTHYEDDTVSWHRGSKHDTVGNKGTLKIIDEIQSDRHSRANERQNDKHVDWQGFDDYLTAEEHAEVQKYRDLMVSLNEPEFGDRYHQSDFLAGLNAAGHAQLDKNMDYRRKIDEIRQRAKDRYPSEKIGYRTPEQEKEYQAARKKLRPRERAMEVDDDYARGMVHHEDAQEVSDRLGKIPADAPFKSPQEYGRLEMKQALIDSANEGDRYLGITPSEGPIGWFGFNNDNMLGDASPQIEGSKFMYDKVYPGELQKLARQYGAPFGDVEMNVRPTGKNVVTNDVMAQGDDFGAADLPDYLEMIGDGHQEDWMEDMGRVVQGFRIPATRYDLKDLQKKMAEDLGLFREAYHAQEQDAQEVIANRLVQRALDLDNRIAQALPKDAGTKIRKVPSMELTPEVIEKIKKAGVPIWAITSGLVGLDQIMGAQEEPAYARGGLVRLRKKYAQR